MSEQQQQQQSQYPPMFLELEVNALKAYLVIQLEPMYVISPPLFTVCIPKRVSHQRLILNKGLPLHTYTKQM